MSNAEDDKVLKISKRVMPHGYVIGYCPMGCGSSLIRNDTGMIMCISDMCPQPMGVQILLSQPNITHHRVQITWMEELGVYRYHAEHPLYERIDNSLMSCGFSAYMEDDAPHYSYIGGKDGYYDVKQTEDGWQWEYRGD